MSVKQTAGRDALNDFAPKFAELNDDVLFGEVWSREDKLSLKMRSIVTVSALVSYEIVDNGQNIKFEINDSRYRDKVFYTSMSNVELVYRDNNVDYGTDYAVYPGNASKFGKGGK